MKLVAAAEALKLEGNALYSDSKHEEVRKSGCSVIRTPLTLTHGHTRSFVGYFEVYRCDQDAGAW
jgi:hypothetical protein